nr:hypothetical protein [Achromobacter sp. DMS1]
MRHTGFYAFFDGWGGAHVVFPGAEHHDRASVGATKFDPAGLAALGMALIARGLFRSRTIGSIHGRAGIPVIRGERDLQERT